MSKRRGPPRLPSTAETIACAISTVHDRHPEPNTQRVLFLGAHAMKAVEVLGVLPEQRTGTGLRVTPLVGLVVPPLSLRLAAAEVDDAFEARLTFILDAANHRRETAMLQGAPRTYDVLQYRDHRIWGASAAILVTLAQLMSAGSSVGAST